MEKLRSQWQDDRLQRLSTGQRRLTFKGWLDHTGKAEKFAFLENLSKEITALLKENDYSLFDIPEGSSQQQQQQQPQRQPNTLSGAIQPASPAEPQSPVDVTMSNAGDDGGEATHTHENPNTLDGDVSAEEDFHSLPPSPK
ncbi:hypothetical protein BBK36DRAFT_1157691 [Trichoderma citrinoviride]|uniref:Uncharacterized protein n=1 Tax=Trichoderma citrinoviride TaxID=58853 RepID=A0A2T4BFA0_9HYPO|nr:hypothetical protein BBK36DRAFT_1157691 [Trichoderma citrinoviride]PTB68013.1 hypothetical protein BBK36DRAFT_1157691 [Trichoderma citrinoviride]